jgi:hypothetical protein
LGPDALWAAQLEEAKAMRTERARVFAALAAGALAMGAVLGGGAAPAVTAAPVWAQADDTPDQLIFKDGRIIQGKVIEETDTHVKFLVVVAGISGEQTYSKADILAIERTERAAEGEAPPATTTPRSGGGPDRPAEPVRTEASDDGAPRVYVMELEGKFGRDIAPTPIREMVKDAGKHKPDYLIVVLDNAWENQIGEDLPDFAAAFDQLFLTEDIEPIFTKEIRDLWGYEPHIVVWVKNAMGGAAFLPLNFRNIYFAPRGKMGGIGNLTEIFGSTGDEIVREKQFSLRMGHARGMAVRGGYDTRIVEAMTRVDYVLSYRIENGLPVFEERMPKIELGERLLTDDGDGDREDTIEQLARNQGNDTLTLTADVAADLGISKGTAEDLDSLLFELQIERRHQLVEGGAERITKQWGRSLESAERSLRDLWKAFNETEVTGDRRERTAARATKMRKLREIISLLKKYDEVYKIGLLAIPEGLPPVPQLEVMHEQLRQEQMRDR